MRVLKQDGRNINLDVFISERKDYISRQEDYRKFCMKYTPGYYTGGDEIEFINPIIDESIQLAKDEINLAIEMYNAQLLNDRIERLIKIL